MKIVFYRQIYLFIYMLLMLSCSQQKFLQVGQLKCEALINPLGIDNTTPHFSWILTSPNLGEE